MAGEIAGERIERGVVGGQRNGELRGGFHLGLARDFAVGIAGLVREEMVADHFIQRLAVVLAKVVITGGEVHMVVKRARFADGVVHRRGRVQQRL